MHSVLCFHVCTRVLQGIISVDGALASRSSCSNATSCISMADGGTWGDISCTNSVLATAAGFLAPPETSVAVVFLLLLLRGLHYVM